MNNTIIVNQVDMEVKDNNLVFDQIEVPSYEGQTVYGYLDVVTISDSYLQVEIMKAGKFRFVFHRNQEITAIGITHKMKVGENYEVTARNGHDIGIQSM